MARGWESKSVEDQISEAEATKNRLNKPRLTEEQIERARKREGLILERNRIIREMERAYMRRHLVMLERGLRHVERELADLEQLDQQAE